MPTPLEGKRILLVDDDNDILTAMQAAFEPTGATVETAIAGPETMRIHDAVVATPASTSTAPVSPIRRRLWPSRSG